MTLFGIDFTWELDGWIIVAGALSAMSCALLGNFLILRKMSMMGDAISHAVLPGLAIAFLVTQSRDSISMLLGAGVIGVLTAVLTQWIHSMGKVEHSASMGVVFTTLFAIGLILIRQVADHVDLDPQCVLYGVIETMTPAMTPDSELINLAGLKLTRPIAVLLGMLTANVLFVALFYKELKISSFDPELATTLGINATLMHYALMTMVAATTVACFESVGSILVIAMLIVPGATAYLLTDRLWLMLVLSLIVAVASSVFGHLSATIVPSWFDYSSTATAPMMAVVAGLIFTIALLFAPRHGVISKLLHRASLSLRVIRQDMLSLVYRLNELGLQADRQTIRGALQTGRLTTALAARGLVRNHRLRRTNQVFELTERGQQEAKKLMQSRHLWEQYLQQFLNLPPDHIGQAEKLEHLTDGRMQERLAERVQREES